MAIEFATATQEEIYNKTRDLLKELFGEMAVAQENGPYFGLGMGSAWVSISVYPWDDTDAIVNVRSWVVTNVEMVPDLMRYLLEENDTMRFGAFGIDKDSDIFFEYAIVGSTMDKAELRAAVLAVAYTADREDDEIVSRWGGQRSVDRQ